MKAIHILYIILSLCILSTSCKEKRQCSIKKSGYVEIENKTDIDIEFKINEDELKKLKAGEYIIIEYPTGRHNLICFGNMQTWNFELVINECKKSSKIVN